MRPASGTTSDGVRDVPRLAPSRDHAGTATVPLVCVVVLVTAFIIYGSLFPFVFHARPGTEGPIRFLLGTLHEWDERGDLLSNILLYIPFGFFVTHALPSRVPGVLRAVAAILAGTGLSVCMELSQFFDEGRVTTMGDVYANAIGSAAGAAASAAIGASMRWPFVRELTARPEASLLLAMFLGYRLFPYVPVIDMHKYLHAIAGFRPPVILPFDLARFVITWTFIAEAIESLYGFRRWLLLFPLLALGTFVARIMIVDLSLAPADVAGAGVAFVVWVGFFRWLPARPALLAVLFGGLIAAMRLQPFTFGPHQVRDFGWVPFWSFMNGSLNVAVQSFFEKFYQYGGLIWLLRRSGLKLAGATGLTAAMLFGTSYAELYLPDRSAEITDAAMALVVGGGFLLLGEAARDRRRAAPPLPLAHGPCPDDIETYENRSPAGGARETVASLLGHD